VEPRLTLNLGVRYTIFDLFHEENGLANPFDFATCGPQGFCGVGASFGQQNYGDVDPRVGFCLDAVERNSRDGDSRRIRHLPRRRSVGRSESARQKRSALLFGEKRFESLQLTYPVDPFFTGPGTLSPNAEQRNRKDSYTEQWSLSVQRELPANFVGTVYYLGSTACICWTPTW
jgi:hypothetical protein